MQASKKIKMYSRNYKAEKNFIYSIAGNMKRLYVPTTKNIRNVVFQEVHNCAHFGVEKTYYECSRSFYWKGMYEDAKKFVNSCLKCQQNKDERSKKKGLLQPNEITEKCWNIVSMDFLTELPTSSKGNNAVLESLIDSQNEHFLYQRERDNIFGCDSASIC